MKKVGIIAEFNPFHNGHKYIIEHAKKELGADQVIIAMSGDFTQSGMPGVISKYERAKMAISGGADLVLCMPAVASSASAETFARCGVATLARAGVDTILFGAETDDLSLFEQISHVLSEEPSEYLDVLIERLRSGESFPAARETALISYFEGKIMASIISDFLSHPNNILGIEYAKAVMKWELPIELHPTIRQYSDHHDDLPVAKGEKKMASGRAIRKILTKKPYSFVKKQLISLMPILAASSLVELFQSDMILFEDDLNLMLHQRLISIDDFSMFLDCSEDLSNRILNLRDEYTGISSFAELLKTKDITLTRITRVLNHILLGITSQDATYLEEHDYLPYIHILAASATGKEHLSDLKSDDGLRVFASINELREMGRISADIPADIIRLLTLDVYAADIWRIAVTSKCKKPLPTEYTRRVRL